jgi:hypothetical protein
MDKKTKMLLGVGVLGVGAYLLYQSQKKKSFANYMAAPKVTIKAVCVDDDPNGGTYTDSDRCVNGCTACCGQGVFGVRPAGRTCKKDPIVGVKGGELRVGRVGRMG